MSGTLTRQDTGAVLVLDGVLRSTETRDIAITVHPVQDQRVITDHAQPRARDRSFEWLVSTTPTIGGITKGDARFDEVQGFFEGVEKGVALTLFEPGMPIRRDLRLIGYPFTKESMARRYTITLREAQIALTRSVEMRPERSKKTPRSDVKAGRSGITDRGQQSTTEARPSFLATGLTLLTGG